MRTLNSHTGYLIIDHKDSPGIKPEEVPERLKDTTIAVGAGRIYESDTKQCSHCQRGIVLNKDRMRARGICMYCHHYICDSCDKMLRITGKCIPFKKQLDEAANRLDKGQILLTDL